MTNRKPMLLGLFGSALAIVAAALVAFAVLLPPREARTQTYPINNPVYLPNPILGSATLSAPGTYVFNVNGISTLYIRVAGTNTGVVGTFQGTEARAPTTLTWSNLTYQNLGAWRGTVVPGNGLYRLSVGGLAQVRFNLTAISTGSIVLTASGGIGDTFVATLPSNRQTYSASITGLVTVASATDFFTLTGATGVATRVTYAQCSGIGTTAAVADVVALKRSTANTGGTATQPTVVPHDSNFAAAASVVNAYTANPTTGTLVGNIRAAKMGLPLATGAAAAPLTWVFGDRPGSAEVVLRAATQVFSLNGAGATLAAGAAVDCSVEWNED